MAETWPTRWAEPASLQEAAQRRELLAKKVAELQGELTAVNQSKPPRYEKTTHALWQARRQRVLAAYRGAVSELQYVKHWHYAALDRARVEQGLEGASPSEVMTSVIARVRDLEHLFVLVGAMVAVDESEGDPEDARLAYDEVVAHYERTAGRWGG